MQQPRWTWSTLAIVTATVALVFGPVLIPREIARWYLAAAANAYRESDRDLGRHFLERAIDWDGTIVGDRDFWIAQMDNTNADEVLYLLKRAVQVDSGSAGKAYLVAQMFIDEFDYQRALQAMKIAVPDGLPLDAEDLNLLAYLRAQAGVELDQALKDINRALEITGNDPSLLDTKAWVLHAMGKDLEALAFVNDAIKKMEGRLGRSKAKSSAANDAKKSTEAAESTEATESTEKAESTEKDQDAPATLGTAEPSPAEASDPVLKESLSDTERIRRSIQSAKVRLGMEQWNLAVLHFHRLRIYEALDRPAEAAQERRWLRERGVPIVDELF